ncbi:hypothetical protein BWQ96_04219 [Gracilariopsis chorda]|uniref:Uncharacterized protein n=1 Tax=Gracilariopsis chorda TaxID=448386 RepID=A0A2V3IV91_9FLOR|nr:hypothetical protein BWQ96_04219 [Gracilariopsis chorda]|eukprot:PXF46044.1 hypothetical protein BWQ96_04219 [Gracilariopsis chorda]
MDKAVPDRLQAQIDYLLCSRCYVAQLRHRRKARYRRFKNWRNRFHGVPLPEDHTLITVARVTNITVDDSELIKFWGEKRAGNHDDEQQVHNGSLRKALPF